MSEHQLSLLTWRVIDPSLGSLRSLEIRNSDDTRGAGFWFHPQHTPSTMALERLVVESPVIFLDEDVPSDFFEKLSHRIKHIAWYNPGSSDDFITSNGFDCLTLDGRIKFPKLERLQVVASSQEPTQLAHSWDQLPALRHIKIGLYERCVELPMHGSPSKSLETITLWGLTRGIDARVDGIPTGVRVVEKYLHSNERRCYVHQ